LVADLEPWLARDVYFPAEKALLSREGGRCARDGSYLDFDPFRPHEHRCALCGATYTGELHDGFWIYWYQLWLAERAVHGALLAALGAGDRFASLARTILDGYAARYLAYPNADNVLGPTRLFFSTYLESIWLLQICVAADLLGDRDRALRQRVCERIVEPSRAIIAEYDEGGSNRQVWNSVALLAAACVLGDDVAAEHCVFGESGVAAQLAGGLLPDGTWYEGENYHLFAHRGLWYGVTLAANAGLEISQPLLARFRQGFAAPFGSALPDLTLPSRRDSQYAISLRQWRIAEHCELGVAQGADGPLLGALERLYRDDIPHRATGRAASSADVERNVPASSLTRADLSWRALIAALPSLPDTPSGAAYAPRSVLLNGQGLAIFRRREGQTYAALDYGHGGGGHGHPDRLNLTLADGARRWLDDYGTGSYVDSSLHWYRSTLAHGAPLVNGHSQSHIDGRLLAYDEMPGAGWIVARADDIAPGVTATRTVVVMDDYLIDTLAWNAETDVTVDLPVHAGVVLTAGASAPETAPLSGGGGTEDGFAFIHDTSVQRAVRGTVVRGEARAESASLRVWCQSAGDTEWWRAVAPGPPAFGDRAFRLVRARGASGRHTLILAWTDVVCDVTIAGAIAVRHADNRIDTHARHAGGWRVATLAANGSLLRSVDLGGVLSESEWVPPLPPLPPLSSVRNGGERDERVHVLRSMTELAFTLGANNYRRSEQSWRDAGEPSATVTLAWTGAALVITVAVPRSDRTFAAGDAVNSYDNERADINGDGVQLYLETNTGLAGWVLVPDAASSEVRIRRIDGWDAPQPIAAAWAPDGAGYRLAATLPLDAAAVRGTLGVDVLVNEMPIGRERRRGQLVLSGAPGDFVYLRGDRHDSSRLVRFRVADRS
jgi:hypothetical protein